MAQGWSLPGSSTESERSAIRAEFPARAKDTSAWVLCQIHSPAWSGLAALEQQQHPEHTEDFSVRYASTPASSLIFFFYAPLMLSWPTASQTHPQDQLQAVPLARQMYVLGWSSMIRRAFVVSVVSVCVCLYLPS